MKKNIVLTALLSACLLITACSGGDHSDSTSGNKKITTVGSTSVAPLMEELSAAYRTEAPGVNVEIQAVGSSAGIEATIDGSANLGMASRDLKPEEVEAGVVPTTIAYDGIAVVVNPKNEVKDLTTEQITKIFKGEITNWKDVGGADKAITVIARETSSGTRTTFDELLKLEDPSTKVSLLSKDALITSSNGEVKSSVASKETAIGYLSLGIVDSSVKALSIGGVAPSAATVKDKTYPISRALYVLTKGEPAGDVKAFIDFMTGSKGQEVVNEEFITIN